MKGVEVSQRSREPKRPNREGEIAPKERIKIQIQRVKQIEIASFGLTHLVETANKPCHPRSKSSYPEVNVYM